MPSETLRELTARQKLIEGESSAIGIKRYRAAVIKRGIGDMPVGRGLIEPTIAPLAIAIENVVEAALAGRATRGNQVCKYLSMFEYEDVAFITAKTIIEVMSDSKTESSIASTIATRLHNILDYQNLKEQNPVAHRYYLNRIKKFPTMSPDRLHVMVKQQCKWGAVTTIRYGKRDRAKLGLLLIQLFIETTGMCYLQATKARKNRSTCKVIKQTDVTRRWLTESHGYNELLTPFNMPMIVPPKDWNSPYGGGYLTNTSSYSLLKTANRKYLAELEDHDMPLVYGAVNSLQRTAWAINKPIFLLMTKAWGYGGKIGGLPNAYNAEPPPKPGIVTDESMLAWKKQTAIYHDELHKNDSARMQLASKLSVSERYLSEDKFYFPYALDWRGRAYPVSANLNPQGDDPAKALLKFAEGKALGVNGAYWLAVQGANCYGVDKVTFDDRVAFIEEHQDAILGSALNPLDTTWWQDADKPWSFLAFCLEWSQMIMSGGKQEDFISHLPVAFDGTCNGLQNFSAMLRDEVGGKAVGLMPTATPPDVYTDVLNEVEALISDEDSPMATKWAGNMTRDLVKRNAMTMPYGVTQWGMKSQVMETLTKMREGGHDFGFTPTFADANYIAEKNYIAIGNVVIAARKAMDWLVKAAGVASSDGLPITWTTPAGLPVLQYCQQRMEVRYDFDILGKRVQVMQRIENGKLNIREQAKGIAPNFVHSLDASHLMLTVNYCVEAGVTSFAMIHDSYGTHAACADTLCLELRRAFVDQYKDDVLNNLRDSILSKLDDSTKLSVEPLPARGKLNLDGVMDSEYFFA